MNTLLPLSWFDYKRTMYKTKSTILALKILLQIKLFAEILINEKKTVNLYE